MKKIITLFVVASLAGMLGWQIYQRVQEAKPANNKGAPGGRNGPGGRTAVAVEIAEVRRRTIQDIGQFTGSLLPNSQFLVTPKVSGRLEQLLVNVGDRVERDDVIAELDDEMFRQQVDQVVAELDVAKANLAEAQSALAIAKRDFARAKTLSQSKILSQSKLDAAESAYNAALARQRVARATVKNRESGVDSAKLSLSYTTISASWNRGGASRVVGERFVNEGAILRANDPIVSLLDISTIICEIFVIERDYFRIRQGQDVSMTTDAFSGETFVGQVARIAPMLKEESRQARVEIEIPNAEERLKPGMFVRVRLEFQTIPNAVVVPLSAVVKREEQQGVFLADVKQKNVRFVPVTFGVKSNGLIQILEPELSGSVVTLGHHLLEDGGAVVLPQENPPKP